MSITLSSLQIKEYMTSFRSCKFLNAGVQMEQQRSVLKLDFSVLSNAYKAIITVARISGNGFTTFISGTKTINQNIASKVNQTVEIDLHSSKTLEVHRPKKSTGFIEIKSIEILIKEYEKESVQSQNWKDILSKCKYKGLSIDNGSLFAVEGAYLECSNIKSIVTNPYKSFKATKNKVNFIRNCEILNIDAEFYKEVFDFPHFETERYDIGVEEPVNRTQQYYPSRTKRKKASVVTGQYTRTVLDLNGVNVRSTISTNSDVQFSNDHKSITLGHKGSFSIPVSQLEEDKDYILIIECQKINGNGKIMGYISPTDTPNANMAFATGHKRNINFSVKTSSASDQFSIVIERPVSSTGSVLVSRIMLLEGLGLHEQAARTFQTAITNFNNPRTINYDFKLSNNFSVIENDMTIAHGVYEMPDNYIEPKFVIVIPSYKNSEWVERNITSALNQNKNNYRIIFIDDCSPDDTFSKAKEIVEREGKSDIVTLIQNKNRNGAMYNLYHAIHSCDDNEIIVTLDGDDWLAHEKVIEKLTEVYSDKNVWMTYGQYQSWPDNGKGCSQQIPNHIIKHNLYRQYRWCSSHLRTFYTWLFKKIKKEDFLDNNGNFYQMGWDLIFCFANLEMSSFHAKFLPDILYIYNVQNPINDSKVNIKLQQDTERIIRAKPKYDKL